MLTDMDAGDNERILSYIRSGGKAYISGTSNTSLLRELGIAINGLSDAKNIYLAPTDEGENLFLGFNRKYPLPYDGCAQFADISGNYRVLATFTLPYTGSSEVKFASIIPEYKPSFKSDAREEIELTLFDTEEYMTLNAVSLDERAIAREKPSFTVSVRMENAPKAIKLLEEGEGIPFTYAEGYVTFKVRSFK